MLGGGGDVEEGLLSNGGGGVTSGRCSRCRLIGLSCGFFMCMMLGGVFGYFAHNGAFSHLTRDVRIVNGSVVEPNSHQSFPVNRQTLLDGAPRVQRLIGVYLKTKHVPELDATLRLFAFAFYVDRQEGRKELAKYRSGTPHVHQDSESFAAFIDAMTTGRLTVTGEYRMVMSPPGNQMHDHWLAELVKIWISYKLPEERIASLKQCFSSWFLRGGFHTHDDFLLEFSSKSHQTQLQFNKKLEEPCMDPMFGKAFITHEFLENGNFPSDLLPTLWNTEYDDEVYI